jgi:hypothetical protein
MLVAVNGGRWTVDRRHTLEGKCLIKEGGADIEAVITPPGDPKHTVSSLSATNGDHILVQWLIEESAIIPFKIWSHLGSYNHLARADAGELSSLLKVLLLLPMSPDQINFCRHSSPSSGHSMPSSAHEAASSGIDCHRIWSSSGPL